MAVKTRNSTKKSKASKASSLATKRRSSRRNISHHRAEAAEDDTSIVSDDTRSSSPSNNNILISPRVNEFSERTWWMVDMFEEEDNEEGNVTTQGATALVKRCIRVYGWDLQKTRKVLSAYKQFLTLKKQYKDWDATLLSPSLLIDQMWHQHILDVVNYNHDMMLLCGHVVGHNPDGASDGKKKAERDATTRNALEQRFPNKYDKEIWGVASLKVGEESEEEETDEFTAVVGSRSKKMSTNKRKKSDDDEVKMKVEPEELQEPIAKEAIAVAPSKTKRTRTTARNPLAVAAAEAKPSASPSNYAGFSPLKASPRAAAPYPMQSPSVGYHHPVPYGASSPGGSVTFPSISMRAIRTLKWGFARDLMFPFLGEEEKKNVHKFTRGE